jgi:hypothetical protein
MTLTIGAFMVCRTGLTGDVVAAIKCRDSSYVAVFKRDMSEAYAYSTHYLYFADGGWCAEVGHYDLTRDDALISMINRAGVEASAPPF